MIAPPSVVNAASYSQAGLPNAGIAPGSIFTVFGSGLGPVAIATAASYPLSTALAGTSAQVTVNGVTVSPFVLFTLASQVGMILPSSTPIGNGTITIIYNGQASPPAQVQISDRGFGIFTLNEAGSGPAVVTDSSYAQISPIHAASPGDILVLWGTGLGPISADETQPPPQGNLGPAPIVWVGSQNAQVLYWGRAGCCGGVDQINFEVPPGVTGCYVPVAVQTGGTVSNFGSIAVGGGGLCSDPFGLPAAQLTQVRNGQDLSVATLDLSRSIVSPASTSVTTADSGGGTFLRYTPAQFLSSSFGQAVSLGYCTVFPVDSNATFLDPVQPLGLDAGPSLEIGGANGTVVLAQTSRGHYHANLGSSSKPPLFLNTPGHTINVFGGTDVGALAQEVQMPPALDWTNQSSLSTVSESNGVTVSWTQAVPNGYVRITGYSLSQEQNGSPGAGASFACTALAGSNGQGQFFVPPYVLQSLPLTAVSGSAAPVSFLGISSTQTTSDAFSTVRGIDIGFADTTVKISRSVVFTQ